MEIRPQLVVQEQPKPVPTSRLVEKEELQKPIVKDKVEQVSTPKLVEEKELQQPMSNGKKIFQEIFERKTCLQHYSSMHEIKNENHDEA